MPPRPVVAAAIVDSLKNPTVILAAERSYPKSLAGMFELPGGKVDADEDPRHALHREILEELGVDIILGDPVPAPKSGTRQMEREHRTVASDRAGFAPWPILQDRVMWVWLAELAPAEEPKMLGSHNSLVWVTPRDALALPWLPTNIPIVKACIQAI